MNAKKKGRIPIGSKGTGRFAYIYHKKSSIHVGEYTIHLDTMGTF